MAAGASDVWTGFFAACCAAFSLMLPIVSCWHFDRCFSRERAFTPSMFQIWPWGDWMNHLDHINKAWRLAESRRNVCASGNQRQNEIQPWLIRFLAEWDRRERCRMTQIFQVFCECCASAKQLTLLWTRQSPPSANDQLVTNDTKVIKGIEFVTEIRRIAEMCSPQMRLCALE